MNELINKNISNVEKFIRGKGFTNNHEIQQFKINVLSISNQKGLEKADPMTIIQACYKATQWRLSLDQNLGYCYVVPYSGQAQFQMGYKGYIQLAHRTNAYCSINVSDVREDELLSVNRLTGLYEFKWIENDKERSKRNIVGYVSYIKLNNGFEKQLYWSSDNMDNHFSEYSKSYNQNTKKFRISNYDVMAKKTMLRQIMLKWGVMSDEMKEAYKNDYSIITGDDERIYIDNPKNDKQKFNIWNKNDITTTTDYKLRDKLNIDIKEDEIQQDLILKAREELKNMHIDDEFNEIQICCNKRAIECECDLNE